MYRYGLNSVKDPTISVYWSVIHGYSSMTAMNTQMYLTWNGSDRYTHLHLQGYYSFYNVTLTCAKTDPYNTYVRLY